MTDGPPLSTRHLNPAEAFLALRDFYARANEQTVEETADEVRPETTLAEFFCDDITCSPGELVAYLGLHKRYERGMVECDQSLNLAEFADWLSEIAEVPAFAPAVVLGKPCLSAGAFLSIRKMLADAGADVSRVAPSTPLLPYLWHWPQVFDHKLAVMAPGRLPPVRFLNGPLCRRTFGLLLVAAGLLLSYCLWTWQPVVAVALVAVSVKLGLIELARLPFALRRRNWQVDFGQLYDFRDLTDALLGRPLRPRPQPT
jgi:hypothetical protein